MSRGLLKMVDPCLVGLTYPKKPEVVNGQPFGATKVDQIRPIKGQKRVNSLWATGWCEKGKPKGNHCQKS